MLKSAEESGGYEKTTGSALALAKLYASVNVAMADAAIECWREKCAFHSPKQAAAELALAL